jgi:hypothetical protein
MEVLLTHYYALQDKEATATVDAPPQLYENLSIVASYSPVRSIGAKKLSMHKPRDYFRRSDTCLGSDVSLLSGSEDTKRPRDDRVSLQTTTWTAPARTAFIKGTRDREGSTWTVPARTASRRSGECTKRPRDAHGPCQSTTSSARTASRRSGFESRKRPRDDREGSTWTPPARRSGEYTKRPRDAREPRQSTTSPVRTASRRSINGEARNRKQRNRQILHHTAKYTNRKEARHCAY